MYKMETRF